MEKEIIHYAANQDPETRRKVLRHPDVAPLVREIIRCTLDVIHSAHHLQMVQSITRGVSEDQILNDGMHFLCKVESADVIGALSEYVCGQGMTDDQMAKMILRSMLLPKAPNEKPVDLSKDGGSIASLVGDMLEGMRRT